MRLTSCIKEFYDDDDDDDTLPSETWQLQSNKSY